MIATLTPLPPLEAIAAFEARGGRLEPSFDWRDIWEKIHAQMFTVAKSTGFDILKDIHEALAKALAEGRTFQDFAKDLRPLLEAKGWWGRSVQEDPHTGEVKPVQLGSAKRLRTIFDTNMRVSYASGHWAQFERTKRLRPWLRYVAIMDGRTRPAHAERHNMVAQIDDPVWDKWAPPCGWGCRCTLQSLSEGDYRRLGAKAKKPPVDKVVEYINRRTGEVTEVPAGIDPGWAYNPGKAGAEAAINTAAAQKMADAPRPLGLAGIRDAIGSDAFARFVAEPAGEMAVMPVRPEIAEALGHDLRVALLSEATMRKQISRHPEMTLEDYRRLPDIGLEPTAVLRDGDLTFVVTKSDGGRWRYVAMKSTATGKAAYVTSYRWTSIEDLRRRLAKGAQLILGQLD
ncbi:phage minor head protein [Zavarzinia aquatilis]|uniref:Phage head morphogenesis protein n=1 Tax=Zavarzinia aquatilis TaxID=2211142 RepID=A0A317DTG4_9PROT|nr:phage minor head protein [Zavarzinia aquatilis]PWR17642.1 phage head morphogenesis protein [Zavarzinia aquatilis]